MRHMTANIVNTDCSFTKLPEKLKAKLKLVHSIIHRDSQSVECAQLDE